MLRSPRSELGLQLSNSLFLGLLTWFGGNGAPLDRFLRSIIRTRFLNSHFIGASQVEVLLDFDLRNVLVVAFKLMDSRLGIKILLLFWSHNAIVSTSRFLSLKSIVSGLGPALPLL